MISKKDSKGAIAVQFNKLEVIVVEVGKKIMHAFSGNIYFTVA